MPELTSRCRGIALLTALMVFAFVPAPAVYSQDDTGDTSNQFKSEAGLTAPDGATNTRAKGKAKAFYHDNTGDDTDNPDGTSDATQRLNITAQHLDRGVDYRVMVDGIDWGLFSPRGGSGTLALRFRDPAVGSLIPFPEGEVDLRTAVLIEIVNDETGEVVLSGMLAASDDDGGDETGGTGGDDGGTGDTGGDDDSGDDDGGSGGGNGGGNGHGHGHGGGGNGHGHGHGGGNGGGGEG